MHSRCVVIERAGRILISLMLNFAAKIQRAAALNAALWISTQMRRALLGNSLRSETTRSQEALFSLVSFLYNPESVEDARRHWRTGSDDEKALAIEALDNLCQQRHRVLLLPHRGSPSGTGVR